MPEGGIGTLLQPAAEQEANGDPGTSEAPGAPLSVLSEAATTPAPPPVPENPPFGFLGRAQASLGNPREPGLWVLTQYVSTVTSGTVSMPATGRSVAVELRPSGGAAARLSLAVMQELGLPLTALEEVEIYGVELASEDG